MANYTKLAATAQRLIEKNGRPLTVRKRAVGPTDPDKPWRGATDDFLPALDAAVVGVIVEYEETAATSDFIRRGQRQCLVAANSSEIDLLNHSVVVDGSTVWQIMEVKPLEPGATRILYEMRIQK